MSVGKNIRVLREQKHMSQAALAEIVGVNSSMITQIERGSKMPTLVLAADIATALGVKVDALLEDE